LKFSKISSFFLLRKQLLLNFLLRSVCLNIWIITKITLLLHIVPLFYFSDEYKFTVWRLEISKLLLLLYLLYFLHNNNWKTFIIFSFISICYYNFFIILFFIRFFFFFFLKKHITFSPFFFFFFYLIIF